MYNAIVCAIAKDEDQFLKEWVVYHLILGFDHIIIYDNNSKHPISSILSDYINEGLVTVQDYPLLEAPQLSAYFHCIKNWKEKANWIAFINIDEFIVPLNDNDIRDFLDRYDEYAGVGIHWMVFNSNGYLQRPKGNVIENYTESIGLNHLYKSIVHQKYVIKPVSPHHFQYNQKYCVNEDEICLPNAKSYPTASTIQINHYYYKSQQDFEEKIIRGIATAVKNVTERKIQAFYDHLNVDHEKNTSILRFIPILNIFLKKSAHDLSKFIQEKTFQNTDQVIKIINDLNKLIIQGDIITAERQYRNIIRYVHIPTNLYFWNIYLFF